MVSDAATAIASRSMPASERSGDRLRILDAFDQQVDAVTAPEQLAIEHHGGHAEHAERLGLVDDTIMFRACRPVDVSLKILCRSADVGDHSGYLRQLVDFEIVAPEAPEHCVMVRPEQLMPLGEQHAGA